MCQRMFIYRLSGYMWRRGRLTHRDNFLGIHIVTAINFKLVVGTSLEVELKRERHTIGSRGADHRTSLSKTPPIDANVHPSAHTQFYHVEDNASGGLGRQSVKYLLTLQAGRSEFSPQDTHLKN